MKNIRLSGFFFTIVLLVLLPTGCTKLASDYDERSTISEILLGAEEAYEKEHFSRSAEIYLKVNEYFPYSDQARNALVKAIEAYHAGSEFHELRSLSKRFLALYPQDRNAPFAKYMIGMSHFEQIIDVERDQGSTRDSIKEFSDLISLYPKSKYVALARKNIRIAENQLAGQEMAVGRYYLKKDNPLAALKRFQTVASDHKGTPFYPESLYRMVETYLMMGVDRQAFNAYNSLSNEFPDSKWASLASILLRDSQLKES